MRLKKSEFNGATVRKRVVRAERESDANESFSQTIEYCNREQLLALSGDTLIQKRVKGCCS